MTEPPRKAGKVLTSIGLCFAGLLVLSLTLWAIAALYFDFRLAALRLPLAIVYALSVLALWVFVKNRKHALGLSSAAFLLVLAWWFMLRPSNARPWQADVALLPFADVAARQVTLRNIRNCHYRSETDYDVRHYDKTFDLDQLRTLDLYLVYWGSPSIAHTMTSFGFDGGDFVCISIETRKERGESYSALRGFFRQFELAYVIADERDLVRLRTNFRNEQVYLYRIRMPPEQIRAIFLDYLQTANQLNEQPRWYNALTHNCTTAIRLHSDRARRQRTPFDWRIVLNGYGDEMLYERKRIDTSLPFAELKKGSLVNARARAATEDNFSQSIRQALPGIIP